MLEIARRTKEAVRARKEANGEPIEQEADEKEEKKVARKQTGFVPANAEKPVQPKEETKAPAEKPAANSNET